MMEAYRTPSKESQEFILANVTYEAVIDGLNGYFASESKNNYITVKMISDKQNFALYEAEAWADILISWLRTEHEIFYRPGLKLDQKYISDRIHEICTAKGVELDDAFLYGDDYTWEDLVGFLCEEIRKLKKEIGSKESGIEDLKEHITLLEADLKKAKIEKEKFLIEVADREEELESLQKKNYDLYLEHRDYIMKIIRFEASRNGFDLPEKVDGAPLSIERTFHDLLELLRKRTSEIKEVNDKRWKDLRDINKALGYDGMDGHVDDFAKAVKARAECAKMALGEKSDVNALIRDYCTKNGIIAPSRYFSDKACVEYLFSVINLKQKDRSFAILQDLYYNIFKRQPDGLSAEDIANKILDRVLETEDLLHKSVDSVNKEYKAVGKQMVDDYEKDLLQFIYKEYKNRIHLTDGFIQYNPPSVRNTVLKIISDYARNRTRVDILETRIKSIFDKCKANFTVDDYVLNGDPTTSFMLDCISSWISSPAESRGKTRAEIENYKLKLKDYILKDIKEHGYRYDGLEKKSIEEIVDWIITMATSEHSYVALSDIYTTVASPVESLHYNNCDGPTVGHMKEYILRRFESLNVNIEYSLKKMAELDKCHKDLKTLEEQRDEFMKQNAKLAIKIDAKDDEISRLKDLINAMNEEVKDM